MMIEPLPLNTLFTWFYTYIVEVNKAKDCGEIVQEVEYRALTNAASLGLWLSNLLKELGVKLQHQLVLFVTILVPRILVPILFSILG